MQANYRIALNGCDDSTKFEIELTEAEYAVVKKIRDLSHEKSESGCMPTMEVEPVEG